MYRINDHTIQMFKESLCEDEKSEATVEKYVSILKRFMQYLNGEMITKRSVLAYRENLMEKYAAQTVNGTLSAINSYLDQTGQIDCKVELLKIQRRSFCPSEEELTQKEFKRLIQTAKRQGKHRLMLLMETICATGIRVSEVQYITVEAAKKGRTEISLKGKIRTILLPNKLCRKLSEYAKKEKISSGKIFLTRNGTPLSRKQIWAQMKELCTDAKVQKTKVFPHNLRHLFARCFYQLSKDVVKLADVLGHSSIQTTRIYLLSAGEEHTRTLNQLQLIT